MQSGARPIDWSRIESLDVGVPTIRVNTSAGYAPDIGAILTFVRASADA